MKIGEVADKYSIPASTIRYYEKIGLIEQQRRISGLRVFDQRALIALKLIRISQSAGFKLSETKSLLDAFSDNSKPNEVWKKQAQNKRESIRLQIKELTQMDRLLSEFLSCECPTLKDCINNAIASNAND